MAVQNQLKLEEMIGGFGSIFQPIADEKGQRVERFATIHDAVLAASYCKFVENLNLLPKKKIEQGTDELY